MKRFLASAFLLLCPAVSLAQLEIKGDGVHVVKIDKYIKIQEERTVVEKFPVELSVKYAPKTLYFWEYAPTISVNNKGKGVLEILSAPKGETSIKLKKVIYDKALDDFVESFENITFIVGEVPPPVPPVPPVPPIPPPVPPIPPIPPPTDPFKKALLDAYKVESEVDKAKLPNLIGVFRFMANDATLKTKSKVDELMADLKEKRVRDVGIALPGVRNVIGDALEVNLTEIGYLNPTVRQKHIDFYNKIATALGELK